MSVSFNSSLSALNTLGTQTQASWRKDFRDLSQALASGDLSAAQSAFTALTQDQANAPNSPANTNSPLAQDFKAIGDALQSGDLQGAQDAFAKLKQDFQAQQAASSQVHHGHHHGHHHQVDTEGTDPTDTTGSTISVTG